MTSGHSFPRALAMAERKRKLKELFGEMSDLSDEEMPPPRDRPPTPGKKLTIVPRVGTTTQRGDRETARRNAAIASPPPPPPNKRRAGGPAPRGGEIASVEGPTSPPAPETIGTDAQPPDVITAGEWRTPPVLEYGPPPEGPPPVRVILPTGRAVDIPFFAVHRSRKYKLRIAGDRWVMRFNRHGQITVCRRA